MLLLKCLRAFLHLGIAAFASVQVPSTSSTSHQYVLRKKPTEARHHVEIVDKLKDRTSIFQKMFPHLLFY